MVLLTAALKGLLRAFHDVKNTVRHMGTIQPTLRQRLSLPIASLQGINQLRVGIDWKVRVVGCDEELATDRKSTRMRTSMAHV
jgi:hypothetical protein